jgi:hypothetical protein
MSDRQTALAPVWTSRRWLLCAFLLWFGCSAIYFLTAPGRIDMFDGGIRHDVTESLIDVGVPAVRDPWFPGVPGRGGYRYAWYELGASVTAIPFVLAGRALGHDALETKQFAFAMTSVPFAAAAVALVFLIYGRLGCSVSRALTWALVLGFCTILWPYAGSSFDAALQAFWLTLAVWGVIEALDSRSIAWAAIAGASFAMLVNIQEAYVVLAGCALTTLPPSVRSIRARVNDRVVLTIGAGVLAGVALIALANTSRYGDPSDTGRMITTGTHPLVGNPAIGFAGLFISPAKSIFLYAPPYAIALIGLYRLVKRDRGRLAPIPLCLAIHFALISSLRFWAGEWAWGPRYLVATLPLVCVGLPFAWSPHQERALKIAVCALGLVVQLLAIAVDHQRYYFDRSLRPFFWTDESMMYVDSPILARPSEVLSVIGGNDLPHVRAFVPGPRPFSMTSSIFGPPPELLAKGHDWVREYLVLVAPRPWPLWSRYVPRNQRPVPVRPAVTTAAAIAAAAFGALFVVVSGGAGRES